MPRVFWNTKADFDRWYDSYTRDFFADHDGRLTEFERRANKLIEATGIQKHDRIWVVGCGLGFLIEALHDRGYMHVVGVDTSPYISRRKKRADVTVMKEIPVGRAVDWIVTDSMLESYDDDEIHVLLDEFEMRTPNVAHLVMKQCDPEFNVKSSDEWHAVRPSHIWVLF